MERSLSDSDLDELRSADLTVVGALGGASNHTLLVRVGSGERFGVYKPRRGERPLWDFASGTLHRREVTAYEVSAFLGWDLVPPTVLRDGPFGSGSVQQFVLHDPRRHYFVLIDDQRWHPQLARIALFDLLVNNADRKGGHVLLVIDASGHGDRLVGIDHGLTFHVEPKLRTVIWELGGTPLDDTSRGDLRRLADALSGPASGAVPDRVPAGPALSAEASLLACLHGLLDPAEVAALRRRAELLAATGALPAVPEDRRPYPWPPL